MNIYEYQRVVGKIDDIPELKNEFISIHYSNIEFTNHKIVYLFKNKLFLLLRHQLNESFI